jgi:hypothetical protein
MIFTAIESSNINSVLRISFSPPIRSWANLRLVHLILYLTEPKVRLVTEGGEKE